MQQRYFFIDAQAYEQTRLWLDSQWGYGPGRGTVSCANPLSVSVRNGEGRVVFQTWDTFLQYDAVASVLPSLLASGAVVEITRDDYWAAMPTEMP